MNPTKQKSVYSYVLKSVKKNQTLRPILSDLKDKTFLVSGGTRGIGLAIAKKISSLSGNVAIFGKTSTPHPKLEGTVHTACDEIRKCNPNGEDNAMGIVCDVRNNDDIDSGVEQVVHRFGGLDGVVLNASALCLRRTLEQSHKEIDLMSSVNINGTFKVGSKSLSHISKSSHPNVLVISPPIEMLNNDDWWTHHLYYSMSKFNMSLMAKFWNKEFKDVGVNTLWPRTTIATAPVKNILGGDEMMKISRKPEIMADAAASIFLSDPKKCTGHNFIDDEVLASIDADLEQYRVNPEMSEKDLMPDFFC